MSIYNLPFTMQLRHHIIDMLHVRQMRRKLIGCERDET